MSVFDKIFKPKSTRRRCAAVIVAAGNSSRMGRDKILIDLGGIPVIARTLLAFEQTEAIDEILVVTKLDKLQEIADICSKYGISKASKVVCGGRTRAESALAGVSQVGEDIDIIAIHDAARPLVSSSLIERVILAAETNLAVAPAVKATDTVRILNAKGVVQQTPNREYVALIQTPQAFSADIIQGALTTAVEKPLHSTDACSAAELVGVKVCVIDGEPDNIKLTTSRDVYLAAKILSDKGVL